MRAKYEADITVEFRDAETAETVYRSIGADVARERGQKVEVALHRIGRTLTFEVVSASLSKVRGYIRTFLRLVRVSEKTISVMRRTKGHS
ncbi:MAG: KEOPS complex subunit Pcc1 [Candidatus Geothermarchaeales archaeon]